MVQIKTDEALTHAAVTLVDVKWRDDLGQDIFRTALLILAVTYVSYHMRRWKTRDK